MSITSITRDWGPNPSIVRLVSTDSTATCTASGYITAQAANIYAANNGAFEWQANDVVLLSASDGDSFNSIDAGFDTLSALGALAPVVSNASTSSATPGTVRAFTGKMTATSSITSGNLVGVRGEVDYVGASGSSFIYGVQGKIIPTGTLASSSWNAGVFGQLDIHAATINAGQIAPIWGDYGATSGTLTDQTGCYGIAMTNTTNVVTEGQVYLYGGSQNLFLLEDNNGLVGATYFLASGTGSGSWGNATPPTPSNVLRISVNGTQYYLPLVAQNT